MKKIFKLLVFLFLTTNVNAEIVNIPDPNFKAALIAYGVDSNSDGEIQVSEAEAMNSLQFSNPNFTDATGLESFVNIETFIISGSLLTTLDLTFATNLLNLSCNSNALLTSINVNGLVNLQTLSFQNNDQITSVDFSGLSTLELLNCTGNSQLTGLNLNGTNNLFNLNCSNNALTSLNVFNCSILLNLYCNDNQLSSLNIVDCPNLTNIDCSNNQLTSLDLTGVDSTIAFLFIDNNLLTTLIFQDNSIIEEIHAQSNQFVILDFSNVQIPSTVNLTENPLQYVNLKNGFNESSFGINFPTSSPVIYICQDENQVDAFSNLFFTNLNVNSYCSFTPGGNYNTITGTIRFDGQNNGCNNEDAVFPYIKMNMTQWDVNNTTFSKLNGEYTFYTTFADQMVAPSLENPDWFTIAPESASISFPNNDNNVFTQDFCISANGVHPDVEVVLAPINPARPGFDATYKLVYKNKGNQTLSGTIALTFNDDKTDLISATPNPDNVISNSLSWNYSNLLPFESRVIQFTLNVNSPQETPAVNIDDVLNFVATINPITGDEIPNDNTFNYVQTVVGSYDPNDITCIEGNVVSPSEIGDYLHYVIRFENTGTAPAEFVVVKVDIDSNKYDTNTLQMLATSHDVYTRMVGNKIEFIFENIQLASGGHGNILLKIKTKPTLQVGDLVAKKADIYFDYNFPIITNNAETLFQAMNVVNPVLESIISIYPNPVKDSVNVTIKDNAIIKSIELFDIQGRLLQTQIINEIQTELNISSKPNGIYFIKINTDRGTKVEKLVKE